MAHRAERQDHLRHLRQDVRQRVQPREPRAQRAPAHPQPRLRAVRAHLVKVGTSCEKTDPFQIISALQGGPSGRGQHFVDMAIRVAL